MKNLDLKTIRHSLAHIMAEAVLKLWPETKVAIGPDIENGFYYDFDFKESISKDDLKKIEKQMKKILQGNFEFEKSELSIDEAKKVFADEPFKLELIEDLSAQGETKVSIYKSNNFTDLCRGPHVISSDQLRKTSFKLNKLAGAYWKGSEKNPMLTRIYALAFETQEELDNYLLILEEAEKRDHRKLGKELDLFSFHSEAPGMPFWHDKGNYVWQKLVDWVSQIMKDRNYEINKTPVILNKELWLQSGHWDHYKENMYFTKIDEQDFALKPMNCPGNILIYKNSKHSYRELPIRAGEFGLVHRHELSGVLSGLFRARCFTQDDAHIYCTQEQMESELKDLLNFVDEVYSKFSFEYHFELSTKPEKAMGDPKIWELAEKTLEDALKKSGRDFKLNPGDGAFYGPKIDCHIKDAIGRSWQCGTIQLDFQMPEKFNLNYTNSQGQDERPVMLHRTILGSVERFVGILIEHYAGKLPVWLSPIQVKLISVGENHIEYCQKLAQKFRASNIRLELDVSNESVGKKIRNAIGEKVPYMLVIGDKEINSDKLNIKVRDEEEILEMSEGEFIEKLLEESKI